MDSTQTGNSGIQESMEWVILAALMLQIPGPTVPLVWGRSGIGKTRILAEIARRLGWHYIPIALNTRTPSDIQGAEIPDVDGGSGMRLILPRFFQEAQQHTEGAIVLLDEVGSLPETMQGASLRLVSEKSIDGNYVGAHVRWIAAANPPQIAAGAVEMPEAYSYRFTHLRAKVNPSQVRRFIRHEPTHASTFPILPLDDWRTALPGAEAIVDAYLGANQDHTEESTSDTEGRWPLVGASPRGWEAVAAILAACNVTGRRDLLPALVIGTIGSPIGLPFLSFERTQDLPQPESNPQEWNPDPSRPDRDLAILAAVRTWTEQHESGQRPDPDRWVHAWGWVRRALDCGKAGLVAQLARGLQAKETRPATMPPVDAVTAATIARTVREVAPMLRHAGAKAA